MSKEKYSNIFSPKSLGPIILKNRIIVPGHSMHMGDFVDGVSPRYQEYLCRRAKGGAAMVGIESAPIQEETLVNNNTVNLFSDNIIPSLRSTAERIHKENSYLSIILWHGGHNISHRQGHHAVAPSPIPSPTFREIPKEMTEKDIIDVVSSYKKAAIRCREAGVDVLEIQTATDYLLGSFLSPTLNRRTDNYGGTLEKRCKIVCDILQEVREAAGPNIAVGVRTSVAHFIPNDPSDYGINESLDSIEYIQNQNLLDYVSVITGSHYSFDATIPPMHWKRPQISSEVFEFNKRLNIPVIIAGRIRTPDEAESILSKGYADIIGMARSWIAEPDWVLKARNGKEKFIRPCMSCNQGCLGNAIRNLAGTCIINPEAGREIDIVPISKTSEPKNINIIGGGPAGLEMARLSALQGHKVNLFEATDKLGGQMLLAASSPYREEMKPAVDWWERELNNLGVSINMNKKIDIKNSSAYENVIWATGSYPAQTHVWRLRPYLQSGIPGSDNLIHGREIMLKKINLVGKILIIDEEGGWPAVSLAETIVSMPKVESLTIVSTDEKFGGPDLEVTFEKQTVNERLVSKGAIIHTNIIVNKIFDNQIEISNGQSLGSFDQIVLSTGTFPRQVPENSLAIGDCVAPRSIWAAVNDASKLARKV